MQLSSLSKSLSFRTSQGSEYVIEFSSFEAYPKIDEIVVLDLVLNQNINKGDENYELLNFLALEVLKLITNQDCIVYFYCDHGYIKKNERNSKYSNQEYRSKLFSSLFKRLEQHSIRENRDFNCILKNIVIKDPENGDHYISLISKNQHKDKVDKLTSMVLLMQDK